MEKQKNISINITEINNGNELPSFIKMYEISGQDEVTKHSYTRYLKCKTNDLKILEQANKFNLFNKKNFNSIVETDRTNLIYHELTGNNLENQKDAVMMIRYIPEQERTSLLEKALSIKNIEVEKACALMSRYAPENKVAYFIKKALLNQNLSVQKIGVLMIKHAPENERFTLVLWGLAKKDEEINNISMEMLRHVPEVDLIRVIMERLDTDDAEKINKATGDNLEKTKEALVKIGLINENMEVQMASSFLIKYIVESERADLIKDGLCSNNETVLKTCSQMIGYAPQNDREKLFKTAQKKLGNRLVEPTIYKTIKISKEHFSRTPFARTGTKATLIGGELKDKTILREIHPSAFMEWQRLYENHELWRKEGFDYIPIEPIQTFNLNKNGLVNVYSGVLELNLKTYKNMTDNFVDELMRDKAKILNVLSHVKIDHGHPHDDNFCLRFFRDGNGNVDFNKKPRLYLIDFDQATSI